MVHAKMSCSLLIGPINTTGITCGKIDYSSSEHTRNLTLSWTTNEDFPNQTSRYVVTALPTKRPGTEMVYEVRWGSIEFINKQLAVEVELGTEYQIKVRTDNCEDRLEGENATITVLLNGMKMCFYLQDMYRISLIVL